MTKHTYSAEDRTWKPKLTRLRKLVVFHVERLMDKQARVRCEIERKKAELACLNELQDEFRKWDQTLGVVKTPEQLTMLPV